MDFFGGEDALQGTQHRDAIKRQWCEQNGITLIEVKYDIEDVRSYLIREINKVARKFNRVYGVVNVVVKKKVTTQASPG